MKGMNNNKKILWAVQHHFLYYSFMENAGNKKQLIKIEFVKIIY